MSNEEIIEGNKLIAEFDGWKLRTECFINNDNEKFTWWEKFDQQGKIIKTYHHDILSTKGSFEWGSYHSSWDWLMCVVEKIESIKPFYSVSNQADFWYDQEEDKVDRSRVQYICIISDAHGKIIINSILYYPEKESKIKATWIAVVEFIKWYNQKRKS